MRVAVLASGSGTLLEAILEGGLELALVVVDRACRAESVAKSHGVECLRHERTDFTSSFDRATFTKVVAAALTDAEIDLVVMAGYGTVLGDAVIDAYPNRVLNTHPALLPSFKGWHAVADAIAAGVKVTGCTVMIATLEMDDGPILAQEPVRVMPDDTTESLHERIKAVERTLFTATIREVLAEPSLLDRAADEAAKRVTRTTGQRENL